MATTSTKETIQKDSTVLLIEEVLPYILAIVIGAIVADLTIIGLRSSLLPQKAPPFRPPPPASISVDDRSAYQSIITRNIFNPDGTIPEPLFAKSKDGKQAQPDAAPVPSQLPLNLIGTLVHSNPAKSIATIEIKGKGLTIPYTPQKEIEKLATLIKVERNKAIFRNLNNGRLEFIEIKSTSKVSFGAAKVEAPVRPRGSGEVKELAPNKYELSRATINKHTANLSNLLMQASTVPRRKANGEIECFAVTGIKQDSIFTELGVQQGDCIKSANGEPINSPAKAMELFNMLKNNPQVKMVFERDGQDVEKEYTIK